MPAGTMVGEERVAGLRMNLRHGRYPEGLRVPKDLARTIRIAVARGELLHARSFAALGPLRLTPSIGGPFTAVVCAVPLRCYTVTSFRFNS
jgi:hypothetical protein